GRGGRGSRSLRLSAALIQEASPSFEAWHTPEPRLLFANRQSSEDPKTGIALYGPASLDRAGRHTIRVGVIGTGETIQGLRNWIERARQRITPGLNSRSKPYDSMLAPDFPGFDLDSPFKCKVEIDGRMCVTLTQSEVEQQLAYPEFSARV